MTAYRLHRIGEEVTYSVDWDDDWLASGGSISSASWAISPAGPTVTDLGEDGTSTVSSAKVSDVTAAGIYTLTCTMISTPGGEIGKQTIVLRVP